MEKYIADALKISELAESLTRIAGDDGVDVSTYLQHEVAEEARYVLSCFLEPGHLLNEAYTCEYGDVDEFKWAKRQVSMLKKYIKKYGF